MYPIFPIFLSRRIAFYLPFPINDPCHAVRLPIYAFQYIDISRVRIQIKSFPSFRDEQPPIFPKLCETGQQKRQNGKTAITSLARKSKTYIHTSLPIRTHPRASRFPSASPAPPGPLQRKYPSTRFPRSCKSHSLPPATSSALFPPPQFPFRSLSYSPS